MMIELSLVGIFLAAWIIGGELNHLIRYIDKKLGEQSDSLNKKLR